MLFLQHGAGKSGDSRRAAGYTNFVLSLFWMDPLEPPISPFQTTEIRPSPLLLFNLSCRKRVANFNSFREISKT